MEITADAFSISARAAVENQGGKCVLNNKEAEKKATAEAKDKKPKNLKAEPSKSKDVTAGQKKEEKETKEEPVIEGAKVK